MLRLIKFIYLHYNGSSAFQDRLYGKARGDYLKLLDLLKGDAKRDYLIPIYVRLVECELHEGSIEAAQRHAKDAYHQITEAAGLSQADRTYLLLYLNMLLEEFRVPVLDFEGHDEFVISAVSERWRQKFPISGL